MKKIILGLVVGTLLFATPVLAQEAPATLSLQQEYQATLVQLIGLLQAQVSSLIEQLKAIQATQSIMRTTQNSIESKVDSIVQNTPVQPTFGATVVTPSTATTLLVAIVGTTSPVVGDSNFGHGSFNFRVHVLDQDGTSMSGQTVTMNAPDNNRTPAPDDYVKVTGGYNGANKTDYYCGDFNFVPGTAGAHTITFTSGNVSTTTVVEVE